MPLELPMKKPKFIVHAKITKKAKMIFSRFIENQLRLERTSGIMPDDPDARPDGIIPLRGIGIYILRGCNFEDGQELAHVSDDGGLLGFSCFDETVVEGLDDGIEANGRRSCQRSAALARTDGSRRTLRPLVPLTKIGASLTKVSSCGVALTRAMTVGVRVPAPESELPLFPMAAFVGLVDGLARRDVRRFDAGRESLRGTRPFGNQAGRGSPLKISCFSTVKPSDGFVPFANHRWPH
jgi:hypothetical protein